MKIAIAAGLVLLSGPALAQQAPDARIEAYKSLLTEANERVAGFAAQNADLAKQVQALTKELADIKAKTETKP